MRTGGTYEHWSRFIAASVCVGVSLTLLVTRVFDYSLDLIAARLRYLRTLEAPARTVLATPAPVSPDHG